ncbi:MAG TPA: Na/Pi cotransporter, partial [Marinobacter hydrocarbonoclasticus]|nr:Na/Pi cotransporter [Marinobacter nauticus]
TLESVFNRYFEVIRALVASETPVPEQLQEAETVYHQLKAATLQKMIRREFSSSLGAQVLDELSAVRRLIDQWSKALYWQDGVGLLNQSHDQASAS